MLSQKFALVILALVVSLTNCQAPKQQSPITKPTPTTTTSASTTSGAGPAIGIFFGVIGGLLLLAAIIFGAFYIA